MWITLLVMAIAVSMEPFRIGMTVLMLNRPRPLLQLIAVLAGGFAMGLTVGLVVIFAFRPGLSAGVGRLHVAQGPDRGRRPGAADGRPAGRRDPARAQGSRRWHEGSCPASRCGWRQWQAWGAAPSTQVGALLIFNVVAFAFAFVELPLLAYLVAPTRTREFMTALNDWIRSRRRGEVAALLVGVGCVLLAAGIVGL
jgi:Sap, sulfolipid-1-addressing protein